MNSTRSRWPSTFAMLLAWTLCAQADPTLLEQPLAQALQPLQERARGGDAQAARVLYQRLEICATARNLATLRAGTPAAQHPRAAGDPERSAQIARLDQWLCHVGEGCSGSTSELEAERTLWLVRAAEAGDPIAHTWFALEVPASRPDLLEAEVTLYAKHALAWLQAGAAAGHQEALEALIGAYGSPSATGRIGPLGLRVQADPVLAAQYQLILRRLEGADPATAEAEIDAWDASGAEPMDARARAAASQGADAWLQAHPGIRLHSIALHPLDVSPAQVKRLTPHCVPGGQAARGGVPVAPAAVGNRSRLPSPANRA